MKYGVQSTWRAKNFKGWTACGRVRLNAHDHDATTHLLFPPASREAGGIFRYGNTLDGARVKSTVLLANGLVASPRVATLLQL